MGKSYSIAEKIMLGGKKKLLIRRHRQNLLWPEKSLADNDSTAGGVGCGDIKILYTENLIHAKY